MPGLQTPRMATAAKGMSLHIGLNAVDPGHYNGWDGTLNACEFDANDMERIAKAQGYVPTKLLTTDATRDKVMACIQAAARELGPGDTFLLTYSGHGGQVNDINGDEADQLDETWCLYDSQLIDDELYYELCCFRDGVRILVLSDSCHSGTVTRAAPACVCAAPGEPVAAAADGNVKMLPPMLALKVYSTHKELYDERQRVVHAKFAKLAQHDLCGFLLHPRVATSRRMGLVAGGMKAAMLLISGCQDNQTSRDGRYNGLFTEKLLYVWNSGAFRGNHVQFHSEILARMPGDQTPNLFPLGPAAEFAKQRPFTI